MKKCVVTDSSVVAWLEFGSEFVILSFQKIEGNLIVRNIEEMALAELDFICLQYFSLLWLFFSPALAEYS